MDITGVFPDRLDATLEEMDRVFHLERLDWEVVEDTPKWLERDDVLHDE